MIDRSPMRLSDAYGVKPWLNCHLSYAQPDRQKPPFPAKLPKWSRDGKMNHSSSRQSSIEWARVDDLIHEGLEDLATAHWTEAELDHERVPLALDFSRARSFE